MKKITLSLILLGFSIALHAQTFTNSTGGSIPDAGPIVSFPITVSGLSPSTIDTVYGLETICFSINHTYDSDLHISIQSPDGTIVDLSVANGGGDDNFTNTCLNDSATTSIVIGTAPFTGTFKPQGFIGALNNGQTGNGTWNLLVQDVAAVDTGSVIYWSVTFGNHPAHPFKFTSSNLPIVVINTFNQSIPDEPKIDAHMGIIYNGAGVRNYMTDPFNNYNNKIGIEIRGSSSQSFPQKSYGFETRDASNVQKDTIILGMPTENDWILYAPYDDKTCMRNILTYYIANKMGHYASRTKLCELVINGQYQGIYVMMEKIKRDSSRVNISKLNPGDTTGSQLTGGYIFKIDRTDGDGSFWTSSYQSSNGNDINFVYVYPKTTDIETPQKNYIKACVDTFENVLNSSYFADPLIGYRKYADENSFIDYFIVNEASLNVDAYRLSTFLYKNKITHGGKIFAGPVWDYNLAWWNANYCNADLYTGWAYQLNSICGSPWEVPFWWDKLLQDPVYASDLQCRWISLRQNVLSIATLNNVIDSIAGYLSEAQVRHFEAWPILGAYTWPNPSPIATDYAGEIANMKSWINDRFTWLDANMPGVCTVHANSGQLTESSVMIYPNPFNTSTTISFNEEQKNIVISIKDVFGKEIYSKKFTGKKLIIDKGEMQAGVYFVQITDEKKNVCNRKIVIE